MMQLLMDTPTKNSIATNFKRIIGGYVGSSSGPLLVCIGGIHGNEPAGVLALKRVIEKLQSLKPAFKGEFLALSGNLTALNMGCRFIDHDLNRMWSNEKMAALKTGLGENISEKDEQRELLQLIEEALKRKSGSALFLDLHTTSAPGAPFALVSDSLVNRNLALQLSAPLILGLEECVEGTILNHINELGHAAIGFEAGQHQAPLSVDIHEAAVWIMLTVMGCIAAKDLPEPLQNWQNVIFQASKTLPRVMEVRYRHAITVEDEFEMEPGFTNFQPVAKGDTLAKDRRGKIRATEDCRVFMPLYQKQGEDGYFTVKEIKPFWLKVSEMMREAKLDRVLTFLPGVKRHREKEDALLIETRIARWFVIEVCHLLGFRKHSLEKDVLTVSRRKQI